MKNRILLPLLLAMMWLSPASLLAEKAAAVDNTPKAIDYYIELEATQRGVSKNVTVTVNAGRVLPSLIGLRDTELSAAMRALQFTNMADALNTLARKGWNVESTYTVSIAGNNVVHVIMRQTTADPADILRTFVDTK